MSSFSHLIPNEAAQALGAIAQSLGEANTDFGASVISGWPGYPNAGTYRRTCITTVSIKWGTKFKYNVTGGGEAERPGFTVQCHYKIYNKPEEAGLEPDGKPVTLPYDPSNLPSDKDNDQKKRYEMARDRVCTNMRVFLGISEEAWKAKLSAGAPAVIDLFGQVLGKQQTQEAQQVGGILCEVDFKIRDWKGKNKKTGAETSGKDGDDVLSGLVQSNIPAPAANPS